MQNKPNFRKPKMNLNSLLTMDYENISDWTLGENKPKQTQHYIKDGSGDGGEDRGWVDFVHRTGPTPAQDTTNWHGFTWEIPVNNCHSERKRSISFGAHEIDISNLFRISDFDIRICCPSPLTSRLLIRKVATMAKTLYIIDGHAHIYAAYYARMRQKLTSPSGEPTNATFIFTTALVGLIQRQKPDMLAVAMDSKAPTFRSEIYPEYKATRLPMPDDMPAQIDRIEQILNAMNVPLLRIDGFEADDIIGTLAKKASAEGINTYICAKDKDMLQLLDDHTCIYDIKTGNITNPQTMLTEIGISPQQFIDCLALQGDTSDNVPGVPDVGPKTALSWIQKYGSIDNLYEHVDEIKGKRGDNLRKFKDNATLSKELVTIDCNVPLQIDYSDLAVKKFNEAELTRLFTELGFSRLLTQLGLTNNSSLVTRDSSLVRDTGDGARVTRYEEPASVKTVEHDYQLIAKKAKIIRHRYRNHFH